MLNFQVWNIKCSYTFFYIVNFLICLKPKFSKQIRQKCYNFQLINNTKVCDDQKGIAKLLCRNCSNTKLLSFSSTLNFLLFSTLLLVHERVGIIFSPILQNFWQIFSKWKYNFSNTILERITWTTLFCNWYKLIRLDSLQSMSNLTII